MHESPQSKCVPESAATLLRNEFRQSTAPHARVADRRKISRSGETGRTIALVASNFPPVRGGSAVVYENLARCAAGRILVVAPRTDYVTGRPLHGWQDHDDAAPYSVWRLPFLRSRLTVGGVGRAARLRLAASEVMIRARLAMVLLWLIVRHRVRAICVGELVAGAWLARVARFVPALRVVIYVHGEELTTQDGYDPAGRRRRRALEAADAIVAVSPFTERTIRAFLGGARHTPIALIENGVDSERFRPLPRRADLVAQYDLAGRFVFVTVCRLLEKKGVDHAIRAFARIAAGRADCRYVVVGTGSYATALRTIASQNGVGAQVIFVGEVEAVELADYYRLGDVFVMPNRALPNGDTEGFGLVFLEANACGLPVIAGRDGGSTAAVRDGENGLVVDGRSVDAIARAMTRLRDDDSLRASLARRGRAAAEAADWRRKTSAFLDLCGVAHAGT